MTDRPKLKVINLFGGPGVGKSRLRAGVYSEIKFRGINIEEVTEYAKELTWENQTDALTDQLYILGNQNRKLERLRKKVDWVVSDSPIVLGLNYILPDYLPNTFEEMLLELWNSYDNYNFYIHRTTKYNPTGRNQNEEEALKKDIEIKHFIDTDKRFFPEPVKEILFSREAAEEIADLLLDFKEPFLLH